MIKNAFKFHRIYFAFAVLLFATEVLISVFAHDQLIRPYGGDILIVIFMYCTVKSFFNTDYLKTAISVLILSYIIEISQFFHLIYVLGLQHSLMARLILGTSFSWIDLVCYTLGTLLTLVVETSKRKLV